MQRKLYDCFLFNDEIELLEVRLRLLEDVVDYFVIVQSSESFTKIKRPIQFPIESEYISRLGSRVRLITLENLVGHSVWARENYSRNMLSDGLQDAMPLDLIMISDIDEIPRPEIILKLKKSSERLNETTLVLDFYNFKFNYNLISGLDTYWAGPVISEAGYFRGPQAVRNSRWEHFKTSNQFILNAGWHFSFLTKNGDVSKKLENHAHQEEEIQKRRPDVNDLIRKRNGFHDHIIPGSVWAVVELSSLGCDRLIELISKYPDLICGNPVDSMVDKEMRIRKSISKLLEFERNKLLRYFSISELFLAINKRFMGKIIKTK